MSLTTPYFEQFLLADGRTTVFPFGKGFDALSPTFVKCQVFNTDGSVIVPDFTVDMATGSITIVSLTTPDGKVINAPLPDSIVRVYRDVPETQEITVASLKTSTAQQIVNMFNNIVAMIQELQYSDEHFTVRSTLPQRDLTFQLLDEDSHKKLVYWDNDKRQLVVTEYPENEVILSKNVYEFKSVDGNLYYLDGEGWKLGSPNLETFITKVVHDNTLIGDNKNTLLGVNTDVIATKEDLETKQDKLTAGDGISIENNVISNTRTNAEWGNITGDLNNQTDLQDALGAKQDKLTAGANISIVDNVISSTAQESFFRGRFAEWTSVPTSSENYTADFHGNTTPSYNDYIVVEDSSLYIPQDFLSDPNNVMIRNLHSAGVSYTIEVVIQDQIRRIYYTECTGGVYAQINDWLSVTYEGGAPGVWYIKTNKEFYINNVFTPTANKLLLLKTNTPYETNFYLSEKPGVAPLPIYGSWRFVYHGVWADDNILGWKPEYQVEETLPIATDTQAGIAKLYKTSGSNTDGAMTQYAVGAAINAHNTATNAHSNIRGVAGGLATLDNNAKVPMSQINDALIGNVSYQGLWDAATNTPFLADPTGGLPAGYKALGYIDFKSNTYIDTGVFIDETDETVEYDIKMTPSRANHFPFGAAGSTAANHNTGSLFFNTGTIEYFAGGTRNIRLGEVVVDKDYLINIKLDQTAQTITVIENDLRVSQKYTGSIISPVSIVLGGLHFGSASNPTRGFTYEGKIYYFIIKKNGVTVKQYQPAQRISDGTYGFYEQVSGEFVVSSGASFTSGGGEIEIPKGYYYITTVAGDQFGLHFDIGDWIISSGGYWSKVDNTDAVSAVNGMTGDVVLNANDVNAYNKTEIDDKFAEVNAQINANTEAIADAKDDINDLQTQINTRTRVIIRRWN